MNAVIVDTCFEISDERIERARLFLRAQVLPPVRVLVANSNGLTFDQTFKEDESPFFIPDKSSHGLAIAISELVNCVSVSTVYIVTADPIVLYSLLIELTPGPAKFVCVFYHEDCPDPKILTLSGRILLI